MNDVMYFIDTNVLSHLSVPQRASRFFRDQCRVPSEVIYEAGGLVAAKLPNDVNYPTTVRVLGIVREIMATLPVGDTALVDLYGNKGSADPLLIACALDAIRQDSALLFGPTWTIASHDKALRVKAEELGVETRTREQFMDETQAAWGR
jgi:hypothetical protein